MKLLSAAALRTGGQKIKFRSRDWVAAPFTSTREVDGSPVEVVCFQVLTGVKTIEGSTTTFGTPSKELVDVFRRIDDYVLHFRENFAPLHTIDKMSMFSEDEGRETKNGSVFNRGIYVTDLHRSRML
ncbi:hypothetical protein HZC07_05180, partial [Candidatus Micrarchaeota archaeon]|nr:hypothetical protein [Candidatus Micrarchaeota archaeon]